jgi:hypothetical protein
MAYQITLDKEDCGAIAFSGYRYSWSNVLQENDLDNPGTHNIPEHVAWEIKEAIWEDGAFCPLLNPECNLARELLRLEQEII